MNGSNVDSAQMPSSVFNGEGAVYFDGKRVML